MIWIVWTKTPKQFLNSYTCQNKTSFLDFRDHLRGSLDSFVFSGKDIVICSDESFQRNMTKNSFIRVTAETQSATGGHLVYQTKNPTYLKPLVANLHCIDLEQFTCSFLHIPSEEDLGGVRYRICIVDHSNPKANLCLKRLRAGSKRTTTTTLLLFHMLETLGI